MKDPSELTDLEFIHMTIDMTLVTAREVCQLLRDLGLHAMSMELTTVLATVCNLLDSDYTKKTLAEFSKAHGIKTDDESVKETLNEIRSHIPYDDYPHLHRQFDLMENKETDSD